MSAFLAVLLASSAPAGAAPSGPAALEPGEASLREKVAGLEAKLGELRALREGYPRAADKRVQRRRFEDLFVDIEGRFLSVDQEARAYEANVTVLNASKAMALKALEIGR